MNPPGEPSGHGTHAAWLRALLRFCIGNRLLEGPGYRKKQGANGYTLELPSQSNPPPLYPFKIYQTPKKIRAFNNDDDWRRVKVRFGRVRVPNGPESAGAFFEYPLWGSDCVPENGLDYADPYNPNEFGVIPYVVGGFAEQVPPDDDSAIVPDPILGYGSGGWNEALIPDDEDTYHIWFSFLDSGIAPSIGFQHGLMFNNSDAGDFSNAISMATGATISTVSYKGYTDPYNILIGTVKTSGGKLQIKQEVAPGPIMDWPNPYRAQMHRYRDIYDAGANYFVGDVVMVTDSGWLYYFIYDPAPPVASAPTTYDPRTLMGAMTGISPLTHTPDPWRLLAKSPISVDYHTDLVYQAASQYLRT